MGDTRYDPQKYQACPIRRRIKVDPMSSEQHRLALFLFSAMTAPPGTGLAANQQPLDEVLLFPY